MRDKNERDAFRDRLRAWCASARAAISAACSLLPVTRRAVVRRLRKEQQARQAVPAVREDVASSDNSEVDMTSPKHSTKKRVTWAALGKVEAIELADQCEDKQKRRGGAATCKRSSPQPSSSQRSSPQRRCELVLSLDLDEHIDRPKTSEELNESMCSITAAVNSRLTLASAAINKAKAVMKPQRYKRFDETSVTGTSTTKSNEIVSPVDLNEDFADIPLTKPSDVLEHAPANERALQSMSPFIKVPSKITDSVCTQNIDQRTKILSLD
eukprot:CAMPEP_0119337042 /NCGR_PEP_ID=MMETSP1333-20130426/93154_1 /TAXON_ID=418940 /ORGANISM="Scyphosphaera apsteinii, Strain RCC1455" /LENGTH=268 /DNA_ID=CAMNT_0007348003 /DNA_START=435 /DNA_END=1241 /DNA_ORIENTATION=+